MERLGLLHARVADMDAPLVRWYYTPMMLPFSAHVAADCIGYDCMDMDMDMDMDMVVGAGFAGAVLAERLAPGSGKGVLVVERRPYVAGNAFDVHNDAGVLIHQYGPHIFHTNSQEIVAYLSRFTQWRPYEHRFRRKQTGAKRASHDAAKWQAIVMK